MKRKGDALSGILVLDKASGFGSTQAVGRIRYLMQAAKAGHGGTLDPLASGVLPILLGDATKLAHDLLDADKSYEAQLHLGVTTDTEDREGKILQERPAVADHELIRQACAQFTGPILQVPPMYSALKKDGKPLYAYAREGIAFDLPARSVTIYSIDVVSIDAPFVNVVVRCSKGTYIRSLARDIGERLGCGAHLSGLRRTHAGPLSGDQALSIEQLEAMSLEQRRACLLPVDTLLHSVARVDLSDEDATRFCHGQRIRLTMQEQDAHNIEAPQLSFESNAERSVRVYAGPTLLGLARLNAGLLSPSRILGNPFAHKLTNVPADENRAASSSAVTSPAAVTFESVTFESTTFASTTLASTSFPATSLSN